MAAKKNEFIKLTKDILAPGFVQFSSKTGAEDMVVRAELERALNNMNKILLTPPGALGKAIDGYTRFFKAYATATPGFHLRNAMSATFMNASDGVSIQNMGGGMKIWRAWEKFGETEPDTWMRHAKGYEDVAEDVVNAVYGSGAGGQFSAAEIGQRAYGGRSGKANRLINENLLIKGSQRAGEFVEGSVRAGMALDTLRGGGARTKLIGGQAARKGSVAEATQRINRIHFNYSDVGEMDQALRRVIPFWTFLSRNVPLQLQQAVLKPKSYLHYRSFVRNFSEGEEQGDLPEWMRMAGGFRTTPGVGLVPQVGLTNLQDSVTQLTTPSRMLAQANPLIKAPIEVMTNYNSFYDAPYSDDYEKLDGPEGLLAPLLAMLGQTEDIPGGGQAAPTKWTEAARSVLPPLGTINRLFGTSPNKEGQQAQAILNFLGVPVRRLTPEMLAKEQKRRRGEKFYAGEDKTAKLVALRELARTG